jgi:hypothetical protein
MNGVFFPGGIATSCSTIIADGSFGLIVEPSSYSNVGDITISLSVMKDLRSLYKPTLSASEVKEQFISHSSLEASHLIGVVLLYISPISLIFLLYYVVLDFLILFNSPVTSLI